MSEPITRDQPIRNALLHRRFDADDERPAPTRRRSRGRRDIPVDVPAQEVETPPTSPVETDAPTIVLGDITSSVLGWIREGREADTPIRAITTSGASVAIAELVAPTTPGTPE